MRHVQALQSKALSESQTVAVMRQIGIAVAKLHDGGLVHGDLTTSNMIVRTADEKVVLIDFGLAYNSSNPEDKGVDLYVLERALQAAHADQPDLFQTVLDAYKSSSARFSATYSRFAEIRLRGRKRTMVG
jgi:TP53 regulating kinase and related kinases